MRLLAPPILLAALTACGTSSLTSPSQPEAPPEADQGRTAADMSGHEWVGMLHERVQAAEPLAEINAEEAILAQVREQVIAPWEQAWFDADGAAFTGLVKGDVSLPTLAEPTPGPRRTIDGIVETHLSFPSKAPASQASAFLPGLTQVDHVELTPVAFVPSQRADHTAQLTLRFDLRSSEQGARQHDRGEIDVALEQVDGQWQIASLQPTQWQRITAAADRPAAFDHATASMGLQDVPRTDRQEAIRRGGYALAVADYDGDDKPDMLVGHFGEFQLLRNTGSGYEDVTAKAGLGEITKVKSAAFADVDNDGHKDLMLVRFVPGDTSMSSEFVAYRNNGDGTFASMGDPLTKGNNYDRSMPMAMADFNGNGNLDVYIGFPGVQDFTNLPGSEPSELELVKQGMWFGNGDWSFEESEVVRPDEGNDVVLPHAAMVADLNGDGHDDLIVVDDRGNDNPIYLNNGDGTFVNATSTSGLALGGWGMGAIVGDYDADGHVDVFMTNVDLPTRERLERSWEGRGSEATQAIVDEVRRTVRGNVLFRGNGDGTFTEVTEEAGIRWVGAGAAVPEWIDYNNDGYLDIYVPNGLWSGGEQDMEPMFVRAVGAGIQLENDLLNGATDKQHYTHNPGLAMLREFRGELGNPDAPKASKPTLSLAGYQRNTLFRNNGDGTFTEVGYLEGVDRIEDGYIAAVSDIDRDGRQDLVLRNCDGSPDRLIDTVTVLQNAFPNDRSLTVMVEGVRSNRDGIGATVTAWVGDRKLIRHVRGVSGAVQSEPVAVFGLGQADKVDRLEVRWPSGEKSLYTDVGKGRVKVVEGEGQLEQIAKVLR